MSDSITQRTPSDDQREPIRTVISKATPPSEIVPDTFFSGGEMVTPFFAFGAGFTF